MPLDLLRTLGKSVGGVILSVHDALPSAARFPFWACRHGLSGAPNMSQKAVWSSGMILASGARGPGFNSQNSPFAIDPPNSEHAPGQAGRKVFFGVSQACMRRVAAGSSAGQRGLTPGQKFRDRELNPGLLRDRQKY